ncbi:OmpA family protein [Paracrocinitomix mangrovi]|uniref:OmpA family protein n=1 Tax=Paracrocinitomix mangrovi TaxID=2862509 RepID=UPI001C8E6D82|nr:OmpA family protein [Paracrocinitomix mangrovi]UKN03535.1 OmpA family protein [Paracrocinitomix mangrovi]
MIKNLLFFILAIVIGNGAFSQGFKMHYSNSFADCFGALEVLDFDNPAQIQFPGNYGNRDDFITMNPDFHEVNSVWIRVEPNLKGKLEFEISTENNVDFSFMLFKADDNSFCEKLENDQVKPIMASTSTFYPKGISIDPKDKNFKPSVDTEFLDVYYLMIHTNSTFEGKAKIKWKRVGEISRTQAVIQDFRVKPDDPMIRVRIRDKETLEPVEANMIIDGVGKDNALFMGTDFIFSGTRARELHIESNTPGYFLFVKDVVLDKKANDDADILIELERLSSGKKLLLEDIKFYQDSDEFLPIAMPALKRLLDFMALNEEVSIEIQGHVNAPDMENSNRIQKLSEDRAKAVRKFLKNNGINPERLIAKGFGNTEMIYKDPKKPEEEEANRRVEILIIE